MSKKKCDINQVYSQAKIQPEEEKKDRQTSKKKDRSQGFHINKQNMIKKWNEQITQVYTIQKKLGEGSFGEVYLVEHKKLKVKRAMKIIQKMERLNVSSKDQLDVLKKLDHSNILKVYEYFQSVDKWYIITEFFEGMQLLEYVITRGSLTQKITAIIFHQIVKALAYVHSNNIAHRDIKAQNILIKDHQGKIQVKVIDWGLGSLIGNKQMFRKCGTPEYCAPQVILGKYTLSCDMWSLGVLLYIMLSGYMPFKGSSVSQTLDLSCKGIINLSTPIWKSVSNQAKQLVSRLIQKDTNKRLTSQECLKNQWLLSHVSTQSTDFQQMQLRQTLIRIKQFNSSSKFQVVVINFILNFIRQPEQEEKLRKQFQMLDQNKDGVLSFEELVNGYKKIYGPEGQNIAEQIFLSLDLDGSGKIQYSEFITFASNINRKFNMDELKHAFKLFDEDEDGLIDMKQINQLLLYEKDSQQSQQFSEIVQQIDLNKDGKIDFNQFVSHINKAMSRVKQRLESSKSLNKYQQKNNNKRKTRSSTRKN